MNEEKVAVRLIKSYRYQHVCLFSKSDTFQQVANYINLNKPKELGEIEDDITYSFIHSGRLFTPTMTIKDLESTQSTTPLNLQVIIKKQNHQPIQPIIHQDNNQTFDDGLDDTTHLHGCVFDREEYQDVNIIFRARQDGNQTVSLNFLVRFLHSYWKFVCQRNPSILQDQHHQQPLQLDANGNPLFPTDRFNQIIINQLNLSPNNLEQRIDQLQFRMVFYLFTCEADNIDCPNGDLEEVKRLVSQYHSVLSTQEFDNHRFQHLYNIIKGSRDHLSCQQIELLIYLYSSEQILNSSGSSIQ